jgi:L-fuconolactonase
MTVDAHQHFWNYDPQRHAWIGDDMKGIRRDFTPLDLEPILRRNKIEGCVTVQVDQTEKETEFLLKLARQHNFIKGVVGWTDFRSPSLQARLEYYFQFPEVKGFRHIVQAEPHDFLLNAAFCRGIGVLEQYNLTYDILVYPEHLPAALEFVQKFPNQRFVIDHLAKPPIKEHELAPWKELITAIGKHEHVYCKVSGMVTEADLKNWKPSDFQPYLETILEAFGSRRLMYGSDWPVCLAAAAYEQQLGIVQNFIASLSPSEKKAIMGENAIRFYHLSQ